MPSTRKGSKDDISGDAPLTLNALRDELSLFKTQLESDLRNSLRKELTKEITSSITAIFNSEIQQLKETVVKLSLENERLREASICDMEKVTQEVTRRHERRNNIIISSLPEPSSGNPLQRKEQDKLLVLEVASEIGLDQPRLEGTFRIGKTRSDGSRLLCVSCVDFPTRMNFLRHAKNLRKSKKFGKCYINPDMTIAEREIQQTLRKELHERRKEGHDVIIRNGKVVQRPDGSSKTSRQSFPEGF